VLDEPADALAEANDGASPRAHGREDVFERGGDQALKAGENAKGRECDRTVQGRPKCGF
jgi:hypothetical protein